MIPGLDAAQILVAMRAIEGSGRLRRANERVAEFQSRVPLAALWGEGNKASSDMLALDASRHLWNARVDPRRRTYAAGIYTHLRDRWGIVHDQLIVLNERQAGAAIEGVERTTASRTASGCHWLLAIPTVGRTPPWASRKSWGSTCVRACATWRSENFFCPGRTFFPKSWMP